MQVLTEPELRKITQPFGAAQLTRFEYPLTNMTGETSFEFMLPPEEEIKASKTLQIGFFIPDESGVISYQTDQTLFWDVKTSTL